MKDKFIEYADRRLDKQGEVQKIHLAKALAENKKRLQQQQKVNMNFNKMFGFQQPRKPKKSKRKVQIMKDISGYDSNLNLI